MHVVYRVKDLVSCRLLRIRFERLEYRTRCCPTSYPLLSQQHKVCSPDRQHCSLPPPLPFPARSTGCMLHCPGHERCTGQVEETEDAQLGGEVVRGSLPPPPACRQRGTTATRPSGSAFCVSIRTKTAVVPVSCTLSPVKRARAGLLPLALAGRGKEQNTPCRPSVVSARAGIWLA